jgi:hypothetical protein
MASVLVAFGLLGCGEADVAPTPTFPNDTGQPLRGSAAAEYAVGPYGIGANSTIPNFEFYGFPNYMADPDPTHMKVMQLADFYNPTGTEVFPKDSPYGSEEPKPKALLIVMSAVWCTPCNYEADTILPEAYAYYQPKGGEFFLILGDGPTGGVPADSKNLNGWANKYDLDYPAAIDPSTKILVDGYPTNFIIRTKDMKILRIDGSPDDAFWTKFDEVLAE